MSTVVGLVLFALGLVGAVVRPYANPVPPTFAHCNERTLIVRR